MYGFLKDHRQAWAREEIGAAVGSGQAPLTRALLFKQLHSYLSRDDPEGSAAVEGGELDRLDIPPNARTNTCAPSSSESVSPSCMINNLSIKLPGKTTEPECGAQSQLDVRVTRTLSDTVSLKMWEIFGEVGELNLLSFCRMYVYSIKVRHGNEFQWLWRVIRQWRGTLRVRHVQQTAAYCALGGLISHTVTFREANAVYKKTSVPFMQIYCHVCWLP